MLGSPGGKENSRKEDKRIHCIIIMDTIVKQDEVQLEPRAWILDLDDTLGQFGMICILVKIYKHFNENEYPPPAFTVDNFLGNEGCFISGFRPGLIELMKLGEELLENKLLDEIVIYTSASNYEGWVDYIVKCIEYYCNIKIGTIGRCVSRDMGFVPSRDGSGTKDMNYIYPNASLINVIMIDDKPHNILQTKNVFGVSPYRQFIPPWRFLRNISWWDMEIENAIRKDCLRSKTKLGIFDNINDEYMRNPVGMALSAITYDAKQYNHEIIPIACHLDNELIIIKDILKEMYA